MPTAGTADLVPLPDLRPLLSAPTIDAADCRTVHRALGEVAVMAASSTLVATGAQRLETTRRALDLQHQLREHVLGARSAAFARVQQVLADARIRFSAAELLTRAAELLCAATGLDRAVLSRVDGSSWLPGRAHVEGGLPLEPPAGPPVALRGALREAEVVRRRQAVLVRDAAETERTDAGFVTWFGSSSYVVAPLVLSDRVVGLLHADRSGGHAVTSADRDAIAVFASELARTYEHAVLLERFAQQRARVRAALAAVDDSPLPPCEEPGGVVRLARRGPSVVVATEVLRPAPAQQRLDRLTEREVDVLRLMAEGATDLQVAVRLVVSESTVKSHVKQILRKLRAANRAEAVYLYLSQEGA